LQGIILFNEKPDVVVAVINAASLERNLYLVAEIMGIGPPLIIALNMTEWSPVNRA